MLPAAAIGSVLLAMADLVVRAVPLDRPIPGWGDHSPVRTPLFVWLVVTMRRRVTA
jgi:iron complex transport system permease protein